MKFKSRNVDVSSSAQIGQNVKIGDNSVIYDNVEIGDDSIICNDTVIGEPLNAYYHDPTYDNPPTRIGLRALIRSHSIIYAGCSIGSDLSTGHRVTIRENSAIGDHCSIGTLSDIQGDVVIGRFTRLHSNVHLSKFSLLGDYVWMFPFSIIANDPYPPSADLKGGSIGHFSVVGVHSIILPGIQVGENCVIGANSVVNKWVHDFSLAIGDPIRIVMDIRKYVALGKGRPYPWMQRYDRGMPWEGVGFEAWMARTKTAL